MPSGDAMNMRNASQIRLCWSAGQKNGLLDKALS